MLTSWDAKKLRFCGAPQLKRYAFYYGDLVIKKFMLISLFIFLHGCSYLNPIVGYERTFESHLNSVVGKKFTDIEHMPGGWFSPHETININDQFSEYIFEHSYVEYEFVCSWGMTINKQTNIVVSWRYLSPREYCKKNYFYKGAW
jgi:hypothetical protein